MKRAMLLFLGASILLIAGQSLAAQRGQAKGNAPAVNQGRGQSQSNRPEVRTTPNNTQRRERDTTVASAVERNPKLSAKLQPMLPAGMTMAQASEGFKNQGQFIAALHVSKNLNIPFDQMKARMTGEEPVSLGKAIQELRPSMNEDQANAEARKAENQARETESE